MTGAKILVGAVVLVLAVVVTGGAAWGHAEKTTTDPADGSKVKDPVEHLVINLTETPVEDATTVEVLDGCDRLLTTDLFTEEKTVHVNVTDTGQPGKWRVTYDTLSGEDGHTSKGKFSFRVTGKKDCSPAVESPDPGATLAQDETELEPTGDEDEGSFPVVPIAAAAVAIIGVALLARGGSKG